MFYHSQVQPSHAALHSLSVEMGGASLASGLVTELMTVVMEPMNCLPPVVCYLITEVHRVNPTVNRANNNMNLSADHKGIFVK